MTLTENAVSVPSTSIPSGQHHPPPQKLEATPHWISLTAILILMVVLTVFGNIFVLCVTWRDKRLHQPNKYFISCLSVADLLVGMFVVPIRLYLHFNYTERMPVQLCKFWSWIDVCAETASILTLTFISIDRYHKISQPLTYKCRMTTSRSLIVIILIWLISIAYATIGIFPHGGSVGVVARVGLGCINDNIVFLTVAAVVSFFLPVLINIAMYALIFHIAHKRQKLARSGALGDSSYGADKSPGKVFAQDLKVIRMLFLVVGTFVICWGPFFILHLLQTYQSSYMEAALSERSKLALATLFTAILPSFNSLCNPIIYACFDREYSRAFKQLLRKLVYRETSTNTKPSTTR